MSKDDKIESVIGELDRLSADLSLMLSRVAALRQTIEFMRRETDYDQEASDITEPVVDNLPDPDVEAEAEAEAEDIITSGEIALTDEQESEEATDSLPDDNVVATEDAQPDSSNVSDDLRKWFTINDRYRFRRELFGNDNVAMTDTINLISAMNSLSEVEDYVYSDLEWDRDNEQVKAFMDIVAFRFSKRY